MIEDGAQDKGGNDKHMVAWMPPEDGIISLEVVDDFKIKDSFKTMSSCDRTKIVEVARNQVKINQSSKENGKRERVWSNLNHTSTPTYP